MEQEISPYSKRVDQVVKELGTDVRLGLSDKEAMERWKRIGPNRLAEKNRVSAVRLFIKQYKDFMILILAAASVISYAIGDTQDALAIFSVIVLNGFISFFQEYKAERTLQALKKISGPLAHVVRGGVEKKIPASRLTQGDVVVLEEGDIVPADCRLVEISSLEIQESILTGESEPVEKGAQVILSRKVPLGEQRNLAFMGTTVTRGRGRALVTAVGMETEIGKIAHMITAIKDRPTPLQIKLRKLGKRLVVGSFLLCLAVFAAGIFKGYPLVQMFMVAVSLGVAVVPEGLPAVVTIAMAIGVQKMARRHAVVRNLPAVEALGSVTVIGSDKTGTLTEGRMRVRHLWCDSGEYTVDEKLKSHVDFSHCGHFPDPFGAAADPLACLVIAGMLCNNASLRVKSEGEGREYEIVGDPTEGALLWMGRELNVSLEELHAQYTFLTELPFDSRRKAMSKIYETPADQILVLTKGAAESLLNACSCVKTRTGDVPLTDAHRKLICDTIEHMGGRGHRVLGFACRSLFELGLDVEPEDVEMGLTFIGLTGIEDPPRPEIIEAVKRAHQAGIRTVMITGDHLKTAIAVALEIGLSRRAEDALSGEDLDRMDEEMLRRRIYDHHVFARVTPQHKLRLVQVYRDRGGIVAMTGDGVNDAPAMKASNVGIAMGRTGTDVAKETADIVLTDDNFATIVSAIEQGRAIYDNIRKFVGYLLSCNAAEIILMFLSLLFGLPVPLSPIQILWLNLVTDTPPALALGADPAQPDVMKRKPRDPAEGLFARGLFYRIVMEGLLMAGLTIILFASELHWNDAGLAKARTMVFAGLAMLQLVHAFNCQSERFSVFRMASYFNRYLLAAFTFSVALLVLGIYTPLGQEWFHLVALDTADWFKVLGVCGILVFFVEMVKLGFAESIPGRSR